VPELLDNTLLYLEKIGHELSRRFVSEIAWPIRIRQVQVIVFILDVGNRHAPRPFVLLATFAVAAAPPLLAVGELLVP